MERKSLTLIATIIGSGVAFLDGSIVTLALPKIGTDLHASFADLQWIVDGYALSLAALILLGGSLGDIFGRKRIYLLGLLGFGAVSLICALSPDVGFLIAMRILQGIFGALLIPGGLAIINTNFERSERGAAIGKWAAWSGAFTAIGPLVGGYLLDVSSWRWIFFINVPLIALCAWLAHKGAQESRDQRARKVDVPGAAMASLALAGITFGLIEGPAHHWNALSVLTLVAGALLAIAFIVYESRHKDPMVELGLFKSRNFSGANLMTFMMYGALSGFFFALLVYLQTHIGYSSIKAGVSLIPATLMLLLFSSKAGALSSKYGPRLFLTIGPLLASLGIISLLDYSPSASYLWFLLPRILLFSLGLVTFVAPLTSTVMMSVDESSSGIASGINNAVSRVAGLIVVAVLGVLGAEHFYRFSIVLCSLLALASGMISFLTIRNPRKR